MPNVNSLDRDMQRALLVYRLGASFALAMVSLDDEVPNSDDVLPFYSLINFNSIFIERVKDFFRVLVEPDLEESELLRNFWNFLDFNGLPQAKQQQLSNEIAELVLKYGTILYMHKSVVTQSATAIGAVTLRGVNYMEVIETFVGCFEMLPSIHDNNQELISNARRASRALFLNFKLLEQVLRPILSLFLRTDPKIPQLLGCSLTTCKDSEIECIELVIDLSFLQSFRPINYGVLDECFDNLESKDIVVRITNVNYCEQHCDFLLNLVPMLARIKQIEKLIVSENYSSFQRFEPIAQVWADICCLQNVKSVDNINFDRLLRDPVYSPHFFQYRAWAAIRINAWHNIRRCASLPVPKCTSLTIYKAPTKFV